jgi:hypothetical protein
VLGDPLARRLDAAIAKTQSAIEQERERAEVPGERCLRAPSHSCLFDLALATARNIEDAGMRASALRQIDAARASQIAPAQAKAGQISQMAQALVEGRTFEEALAYARSGEDAQMRASKLGFIAVAQAEAGQSDAARATFEEALATAREIEDDLQVGALAY